MRVNQVLPSPFDECIPHQDLTELQSTTLSKAFTRRENLLVCAPNRSGKTFILEASLFQFHRNHETRQKKIICLLPYKRLLLDRCVVLRDYWGELRQILAGKMEGLENAFWRKIAGVEFSESIRGGWNYRKRMEKSTCDSYHSRKGKRL